MITIHTVTIIEKTRADYRRTLTELFLSEASGAAGIPTKYEYNVETDNAGNIIYFKLCLYLLQQNQISFRTHHYLR